MGNWEWYRWLTDSVRDLADVLWPRTCQVCGENLVGEEHTLCMACAAKLPRTNFHLHDPNSIHLRLLREVPIRRAAAYFHYIRGTRYAELIQRAKYNNRPWIDRDLARMYAAELKPTGFFDDVDLLLPVPMHWRKQLKRGYNQANVIAEGLSEVTGIPVGYHLVARQPHATQTHKSAEERSRNIEGIYAVEHPEELDGLHVMLVDDVITTGSTTRACCAAIHAAAPTTLISVIALSAAKLQ